MFWMDRVELLCKSCREKIYMVVAEDVNNIDRSFGCTCFVGITKKERKNGENFFSFICTIIVSFIFAREEE